MTWNLDNNIPIYLQIMERIQRDIISGRYRPGDKLPSVRELAVEAAVNPNTMQKALSELERGGLVYSQRTSGRFITEDEELLKELKNKKAHMVLISDMYLSEKDIRRMLCKADSIFNEIPIYALMKSRYIM